MCFLCFYMFPQLLFPLLTHSTTDSTTITKCVFSHNKIPPQVGSIRLLDHEVINGVTWAQIDDLLVYVHYWAIRHTLHEHLQSSQVVGMLDVQRATSEVFGDLLTPLLQHLMRDVVNFKYEVVSPNDVHVRVGRYNNLQAIVKNRELPMCIVISCSVSFACLNWITSITIYLLVSPVCLGSMQKLEEEEDFMLLLQVFRFLLLYTNMYPTYLYPL